MTLLLVMSILAFSDNLFIDVGQPSNRDPKMIAHSVFALGWVVLLAVQAWLVQSGRTARHRAIGPWAFVVAAGLCVTTAFVFYASFKGIAAMSSDVVANRLLLPMFAVFTFLAWQNRSRPERHKRYLLLGTLALLSPIVSRLFGPVALLYYPDPGASEADFAFFLFLLCTWGGLIASLWVHDWRTLRRVHPITLVGSALIVSTVVGLELFWPNPA
ncbi:hypothetical protein ACWPMX_08395 [Tsuneonella sp. HG094]|jgi:hypothetical protein